MSAGVAFLTGAAVALIVVGILWAWARRSTCRHDRIQMHSAEHYANTSYAHAVCTECGGPLKFTLGFVANHQDVESASKVAAAVLLGKGYRNDPGSNIFVRQGAQPRRRSHE